MPLIGMMDRGRHHHHGLIGQALKDKVRCPDEVSRSMRGDSERWLVRDWVVEDQGLGVFEGLDGMGGVGVEGGDGVFVGVRLSVGHVLGAGEEGVDVVECVSGRAAIEADVRMMII